MIISYNQIKNLGQTTCITGGHRFSSALGNLKCYNYLPYDDYPSMPKAHQGRSEKKPLWEAQASVIIGGSNASPF